MAKDLQTSVILETKTAEAKLKKLVTAINKVDEAINKANNKSNKLANNLQKSITKTNTLNSKTKQIASAQKRVTNQVKKTNSEYKKTKSLLDGIGTKLQRMFNTYLGVMGIGAMIRTSDTITKAENKLNQINGGNRAATQAQMNAMYGAAQRSKMGYSDMIANVSKSMILSPDAFGGDMNAAIAFQEVMAKSYALGGASQAEQASSMYQLIQALGSGKLAGDELRSVTEGAPLAAKEIEKFAQEVYKTDLSLKEMGADGMLTSNLVVAAMLKAAEGVDGINAKFENTATTFEQAWTNIKNTAVKAFEPVLQKLNQLLNNSVGQSILNGIGTAIQVVANYTLWWLGILEKVYNFFTNNGDTIIRVLFTIATVIGAFLIPKFIEWIKFIGFAIKYYAVLAFQAIKSGISALIAWSMAHLPLLILIAIIAAVIIAVIWMADSFADACGIIVGIVFATGALILNIAIGLINSILQLAYSLISPIIGVVEWILNVCMGGFNTFGDAVANLIGQIIGWFLDLGKVVTTIIDAIFGTNWTAGLESLKSKVTSWGKNNSAITLTTEAPQLGRVKYSDAYNFGYDLGVKGGNWISNKVGSIGDKLSGLSLPSGSGSYSYDPASLLGDIADAGDKTAGNTGKMADSMEMAEEDLQLLYDLAAMEWKKEFTTANITVDMSNYNTFNNTNDYEGFALYIRDVIAEEASAVANGAYGF